ncbi:MAG: hypothetical protein JWN25_1466 [Verrucomicrobiales bacterium]|nr:hypothetical protein [Verrucomicrobiales bacterium]
MTAPSTRTLVVLAIFFFLAASILVPSWYPPAVPVIGPDGSVMHQPDGRILVHRDMAQFNRTAFPGEICFLCAVILVGWLLIRFFRLMFGCWRDKKTVACKARISFTNLEKVVLRSRKSIESSPRDGELKAYTREGGQNGRGWRVAGFYAYDSAQSRLVFEALHYETPSLCLIRVYRENPMAVLFAKKWSGNIAKFEIAAVEAASVFRAALPTAYLPDGTVDDSLEDMPLSQEDRELISAALLPIPPPCNPDAIEEA